MNAILSWTVQSVRVLVTSLQSLQVSVSVVVRYLAHLLATTRTHPNDIPRVQLVTTGSRLCISRSFHCQREHLQVQLSLLLFAERLCILPGPKLYRVHSISGTCTSSLNRCPLRWSAYSTNCTIVYVTVSVCSHCLLLSNH